MDKNLLNTELSRRSLLSKTLITGTGLICGASALSGLILPGTAEASTMMSDFWLKTRSLECYRADNNERYNLTFFNGQYGQYLPDAYKQACWMLRDAKDQNQMVSMDIGLLNLMYALQEWARISGKSEPVIRINSAYRTSRRNARIEGAARNSLHTQGRAVDIRMKGVDISQLSQMAKYFKVGGVGVYDTFLHVDTGRVRSWSG